MPVYTTDITARRQAIDVTKRIALESPDESQLMVLLMRARKKPTSHWNVVWYDDRPGGWWTQVNNAAGYTNVATELVVDDAGIFAAKDIVKVTRTGEQLFISEVDYDNNTITVAREYGTTGKAALLDDDWLMLLTNAMEENSLAPRPKLSQPVERENYVQTVRTPFDESDLSAISDVVTDQSERKRLRVMKMLDHRLALERTAIWGEKKKDATNKRYLTGGVIQFIASNVYNASGTLTEKKWNAFTELGFKYGSKEKVFVCGPAVGSLLNDFAVGKIQTTSGEKTYGIRLKYIDTFHGRVHIIPSQTFEQDYASWGALLDMRYIRYRPQKGRDTKLYTNIQAPDRDGWMDEYRTKFTMQVELEKCHALLKNAF
jgi:hypothetical protein